MNGKATLKLVPGLLLGMALAGPAFGQSATQSMKNAGNSAESAVSTSVPDLTSLPLSETQIQAMSTELEEPPSRADATPTTRSVTMSG